MIGNIFKHFKKICKHKYYVGKYCFKFGLYRQGITHDLSKFNPIEFWTSVKYYQGNRSPIEAEKEDKGYSNAWLHHFHKNKHHWCYWIDFDMQQNMVAYRMPYKYALEAIADYIGANKAYLGNKSTYKTVYEYYRDHIRISNEISEKIFHFQTRQLWDTILTDFVKYGEETTINRIKRGVYEAIYNTITTEDGKFIIYDLDRYNEIITKYYTKEDN